MTDVIDELVEREYAFGFHSDIDTDLAPKGLTEDVVRLISAKNDEPDWLLEWRLAAFRHFLTLEPPTWQNVHHPPIDYQDMHYWAAPKPKGPGPRASMRSTRRSGPRSTSSASPSPSRSAWPG